MKFKDFHLNESHQLILCILLLLVFIAIQFRYPLEIWTTAIALFIGIIGRALGTGTNKDARADNAINEIGDKGNG